MYLYFDNNDSVQKISGKYFFSGKTKPQDQGGKKSKFLSVGKARLQLEFVDNTDKIRVLIDDKQNTKDETKYKYEWFVNSKSYGTNSNSISGFSKGDQVNVKITPFNDNQIGEPVYLAMNIVSVSTENCRK